MRLPIVDIDPRDLLTVLPRALGLLDDVDALLKRIERTRASADDLVARISTTGENADALVDRVNGIVDGIEGPLTTLQPVLERLADTTEPHEVDALVKVIDQLPMIQEIIGTMDSVAPDLHELLRTSKELNEMLAKIPFMSREDD